jgi:hypothetical protein
MSIDFFVKKYEAIDYAPQDVLGSDNLPELRNHILSYLPANVLGHCDEVCAEWKKNSTVSDLWLTLGEEQAASDPVWKEVWEKTLIRHPTNTKQAHQVATQQLNVAAQQLEDEKRICIAKCVLKVSVVAITIFFAIAVAATLFFVPGGIVIALAGFVIASAFLSIPARQILDKIDALE